MSSEHRCTLPDSPMAMWRCPKCKTRYGRSKRYVGGEMREGWTRLMDDMETRHARRVAEMDAEFRPYFRFAIAAWAVGVLAFFAVLAVIVWVVLQVTA